MGRVGFLWDSLSDNTGDRAVGLTLLRRARRAGLDGIEPVRIAEPLAGRYDMLVIGGGELLQPAGHAFYDLFRVPGEHILNTAGTNGEVAAGYLSSYRLVTVRSTADRDNLRGLSRRARVAPCLTVLFDETAVDAGGSDESGADGALLLHLQAGALRPSRARAAVSLLRGLGPAARFLPFTGHVRDGQFQAALAAAAGLAPPLAIDGPDRAFAAIRRARSAVVASLHAVLFAYVSGVPFLAIPYAPKIRHFLADRGLEHRLLPDFLRLSEKLHLLEPDSVDWQAAWQADRAAARAVAEEIFVLAEDVLARPAGARSWARGWEEPSAPGRAHAEMAEQIAAFGRRATRITADVLAGRHRARRFFADVLGAAARQLPLLRRSGRLRAKWRGWRDRHGC